MFDQLKDVQRVEKTIMALQCNGIAAYAVETGEEAKTKVLELIPRGAEVMTMTSVTLDTIGLTQALNDTETYASMRNKLKSLNRETQSADMRKIGAAPEWAVGSVHAVTENGEVLIASNTGSQLAAYAYGSQHIIWVVGTQKIVRDMNEGMTRIHEYTLPLEQARAQKVYGVSSSVGKLLVINKEVNPHRLTLVFVNQILGF